MNNHHPAEERIAWISRRHPSFPSKAALLSRLIRQSHQVLRDEIGIALSPWNVSYTEYSVLMMMYGSEHHTVLPSQLAEASGEKAANVTRLTNALVARGWIERSAAAQDRRQALLTLRPKHSARRKRNSWKFCCANISPTGIRSDAGYSCLFLPPP